MACRAVRVKKSHGDRHGQQRKYRSFLRRSHREDGKVFRNETVANRSAMSEHVLDFIEWWRGR